MQNWDLTLPGCHCWFFVLLICESSTIQSKKNLLGVMPCVLSKKGRSRKLFTSIYYFGTNLSDTKGYDQSANSSAFVIRPRGMRETQSL